MLYSGSIVYLSLKKFAHSPKVVYCKLSIVCMVTNGLAAKHNTSVDGKNYVCHQ